jgi:hypothetical protein
MLHSMLGLDTTSLLAASRSGTARPAYGLVTDGLTTKSFTRLSRAKGTIVHKELATAISCNKLVYVEVNPEDLIRDITLGAMAEHDGWDGAWCCDKPTGKLCNRLRSRPGSANGGTRHRSFDGRFGHRGIAWGQRAKCSLSNTEYVNVYCWGNNG